MGKKLLVLFLVFVFLFSASFLMARELNQTDETEVISCTGKSALIKVGSLYHSLAVKEAKDGSKSVIDTLYYYKPPEAPEAYDDFLAGYQGTGDDPADTCVNWFTLLAPGTVNKFFMQNERAGSATCYLWEPASYFNPDSGRWYYMFPDDPDIDQLLPFGVPLTCNAQVPEDQFTGGEWTPTWNVLDLVGTFGAGIYIDGVNDSLDFWFGYSMDATGGPTTWQDGTFHDSEIEGSCRSFSTLHSICPEYGCWYRIISSADDKLWVAHMMQIEVEYEALPPIISDVSNFSDTFEENKIVKAKIIDLEGDAFTAELFTKVGINGTYTSVTMTSVDGDIYEAALSANVGDTIYYYVKAEEDVGGLSNNSRVYHFARLEPPINIPFLLVNDGGRDVDSLYFLALENLGIDYYYWNMKEHKGIDKSVIHYPDFNAIAVFGWGTSIVPITDDTTEDEYDMRGFLDGGGNLMLADMDYLFTWGMPATGTFVAGDFAYDYLGIGDYENDPNTGGVSDADLEMAGIANDPITGDFVAPTYYGPIDYELPDPSWANWGDFIEPAGGAVSIFKGKSSNNGMAVRKEGAGFKTVTFAFPVALAADITEFQTLLENSLLYLGAGCMKGDVTHDGLINVTDIVRTVAIILEHWTPNDWELCAADCNNDGDINVADIVWMVNKILGIGKVDPASHASISLTGNEINLKSDGDIGGVQFVLKSSPDLVIGAAPGVELAYRQRGDYTTVVVYTMKDALPNDCPILTLNHPAEITGEIIAADRTGSEVPVNVAVVNEFALSQNYPNPFNPTTEIVYNIPENTHVSISVYNVLGQKVVDLVSANQKAGMHMVRWNGKDANGLDVAAGIYIYQMKANKFSAKRKMFLIK